MTWTVSCTLVIPPVLRRNSQASHWDSENKAGHSDAGAHGCLCLTTTPRVTSPYHDGITRSLCSERRQCTCWTCPGHVAGRIWVGLSLTWALSLRVVKQPMSCSFMAMVHFRPRPYDCVMCDQLLWESTHRDVTVERLIVQCRFSNWLWSHRILYSDWNRASLKATLHDQSLDGSSMVCGFL